ncbi:hypothetical protein E1B28_007154 [Marasmius oreades]|uniref:Thioredoxin domain-containing protein n=1 Tax=Marasmius oreades TaxID=181124 RepID=A0A9P7S153_9AGAR|nr:uncharacterized protein E1B28_007154 [Marasmius oreades]KAG7093479.1 hypothetical protein E1B28_007154 [Marasmius oreades]
MPPLSLISIALALGPLLVSAGLFAKNSGVTMLDQKAFKKVMKADETSMVAFVAPWCGHCQRMTPEFSKAAKNLSPLIPFYAVDCDDDQNKSLCAEQGVQGFPTVKVFPRGTAAPPMLYQGERTASAFVNYVSLRVPQSNNAKLSSVDGVEAWIEKTSESSKPRALLLTKEKKVPTLWKVIAQRYQNRIEMGIHKDIDGKSAEKLLGIEGGDESKVLVYNAGEKTPTRYNGKTKLEPLSKFFDVLLRESGSKDEEEQEQERKQKQKEQEKEQEKEKKEKEKRGKEKEKEKKEQEKKAKKEKTKREKAKEQEKVEKKAAESESTTHEKASEESESSERVAEHPKDEL